MRRTHVIFILMLVLALTLVGCGSSQETPEQAVTNALTAVKNLDSETAQKYFDYNELLEGDSETSEFTEDEYTKLLVEQLSFNILSSSEDGEQATVKTEITNIDLAPVLGEFMQKALAVSFENAFSDDAKSDEEIQTEMDEYFAELLSKEDLQMKTTTVDIQLTKNESGWKIDLSEALKDAVLGGLMSAAEEMEESFTGDESVNGSPESKLQEISNYIVSDIWNDGFCDISSYISTGKSSTGETMDIDFTLQQLDNAMTEKAEYDDYMNSLTDEKYSNVKQIWSKLSPEIDKLYQQIQEQKPTANDSSYSFDTGLFNQYMHAFRDEVWELE